MDHCRKAITFSFGVDPWRITHSIFGSARLSVMMNFCYNLWFFILISYVLWQIVNVSFGRVRMQFLFALDTQDMLWADYLKNDTNIGSGISAMPSMHVAIAALLYFSARTVNKNMGRGMFVFLVLVQIGSVHLGWHYAIDGYFSILLTWGIWKFSGWLVARVYGPVEYVEADTAIGSIS